ncbi:MAG: hypothetical protein D6753_18630 [Planctomycetota bacterium]|nr:MAG: hypothetical protein D6753_18630 [Planctomycetota bacterium]
MGRPSCTNLPGSNAVNKTAWKNGRWGPLAETMLDLDDWGVLSGAMVVDRLRTVQGQPRDVSEHLDRFQAGCRTVGIKLPAGLDLAHLIEQCAARNLAAWGGIDLAIVLLATPGRVAGQQATLVVHPAAIDHARLRQWYATGQPLAVADQQSVPAACWSPHLKVRSRLNYYLADRAAQQRFGPTAGAVLQDATGCLTETSAANILIAEGQRLVSPPPATILPGVSLQRTERLAAELGIELRFEPISIQRAIEADGLMLCGSVGCWWFASRLENRLFDDLSENPLFRALREAWARDLGVDYQELSRAE